MFEAAFEGGKIREPAEALQGFQGAMGERAFARDSFGETALGRREIDQLIALEYRSGRGVVWLDRHLALRATDIGEHKLPAIALISV